jgi:hypothetical protein
MPSMIEDTETRFCSSNDDRVKGSETYPEECEAVVKETITVQAANPSGDCRSVKREFSNTTAQRFNICVNNSAAALAMQNCLTNIILGYRINILISAHHFAIEDTVTV